MANLIFPIFATVTVIVLFGITIYEALNPMSEDPAWAVFILMGMEVIMIYKFGGDLIRALRRRRSGQGDQNNNKPSRDF